MLISIQLFALGVVAFVFYSALRRKVPKGLRLPPGPRPNPLTGNLLDMPKNHEWLTYSKWAKEYGEIVHITIFGTHMYFLNSRRLIYELFERRSSNYSDRTVSTMLYDLLNFKWVMGFQRYGDWWRRHRRVVHEKFHPNAVEVFKPVQLKYTRKLLGRLLQSPKDFSAHLRYTVGAVIIEVGYGIQVEERDDPYLTVAEEAMTIMGATGTVGTYLVDMLPILKFLPEWFPGANFQRQARQWRIPCEQMAQMPFEAVKNAIATGTAQPSFTSALLEELASAKNPSANQEEVIRNSAASIFTGGADTTVNTLRTLLMLLTMYPDAQRKAQQELDDVLMGTRLPEFDDKRSLPYIDAVVKEVLRWHPLLPLAVAHTSLADDVFEGYFIPAGSIVFGNVWHICHDEAEYGPDADKFIPERFFRADIKDPNIAFGFGRRICPGRYMAINSLFIGIASLLQVFDILPPLDENGNEKLPKYDMTSGLMSFPTDFECRIVPRSRQAEQLIMQSLK